MKSYGYLIGLGIDDVVNSFGTRVRGHNGEILLVPNRTGDVYNLVKRYRRGRIYEVILASNRTVDVVDKPGEGGTGTYL